MSNVPAPRRPKRRLLLIGLLALIFSVVVFVIFQKPRQQVDSGLLTPYQVLRGHSGPLWAVRFSPNGELLASGGADTLVKVWQLGSGKLRYDLYHPVGITSLAFSPDGRYLAAGGYDARIRLWNMASGAEAKAFSGFDRTVWSVVFSPDGQTIAGSGEDATIGLWDVASGKLLHTLQGHQLNIWKVRFTPDGQKLVSGSFDETVRIWDATTGELLHTLEGHTQAIVGLAISPDGSIAASGSDDCTVRLWDIHTGRLIRTLRGDSEHIYTVAFSPDGRWLLSGGRDRGMLGELWQNFFGPSESGKGITMRLWDVETGELLQTLSEHTDDVHDVAFSSAGRWAASASVDGTVRIYRSEE